MNRREIIGALQKMAFAAEVLDEQDYNPKGLAAGAWTLRSLEGDLGDLVKDGTLDARRDLTKQVKDVVRSLVEEGQHPGLAELVARVPAGLFDVQRIKGLGPKKVRALWTDLGITSLTELEYACTENRLVELKGFGKKTQEKVLAGLHEVQSYLGRFRLDQIDALAATVLERLADAGGTFAVVGERRRGKETVGGLDLLTDLPLDDVRAPLLAALALDAPPPPEGDSEPEALPERGDAAVMEVAEPRPHLAATFHGAKLRVFSEPDPARRGAALVFLTSSPEHLALLDERAREEGGALDEVGLTLEGELHDTPDEDSVYAALGLLPTAPERREPGVPLVEQGTARPRLIRRSDLLGSLHNHTVASDGIATLAQMQAGAAARGLTYLGITEHSQTAAYAGGLTADGLEAQRRAIAALPQAGEAARCRVLLGVESDILAEGQLDYPDDVLERLEIVVASVHMRNSQNRDAMTARMLQAAAHPAVDIVGHPTGRMLLGRPPSDYDVEALLDACRQHGCAVELNAQPARLDLNEVHLAQAKERGVLVSIAADAHSVEALDYLDFGVTIARRAGLGPDDVLNARSFDELWAWLGARRPRVAVGAAPAS